MTSSLPGATLYYVDEYTDEMMPCAPTLEAWADWLSKPSESWNRDEPAPDGAQFAISAMTMLPDIVATRGEDGTWSFSGSAADADFVAIRWGEGMTWDADGILWRDNFDDALRDWFADTDNTTGLDGVFHIAVAKNEAPIRGTFRAGPPPSLTVETLQ